jgi:anti-sigma-K factor RskA
MTAHAEVMELVDLYALDALEGREAIDFEAHLPRCESCQARLAEARTVTAALVADSAPPNHVWDRILADIEPQRATVTELPRRRGIFLALSAVAAALAITLGGVVIASNGLSPEEAIVAAAEDAAAAPGSTVAAFIVDDVTVAEVVLASDGSGYVLPTESLVDLDESRTYQLWVINEEGSVISGGVLGNSPQASSFTWTDGVSGFALTREVAGGVAVSEGDVVAVVTDL